MIYFLICVNLVTLAFLVFSIRKNIEFLDKLMDVQETAYFSLSSLDEVYKKIKTKSELELFSDEPIVRELVQDMNDAKEAVSKIKILLDDEIFINDSDEEEKDGDKLT